MAIQARSGPGAFRQILRSQSGEEVKITSVPATTADQITASLLAILAFFPATFCTGYLAAWFSNLHNFRQRSLVERAFWSLPLSLAVSAISSVLIGKLLSLTAVVVFFLACTAICLATLATEWFRLRQSNGQWIIGYRPLGSTASILALIWIVVAVLSLVDFYSGQQVFMSITILDHGARVNWIESVLRTGVPPSNPLYWYKQPATMRNYYFWYVLCAAVSQMSHLPVRAVLNGSCVWAGFALVALNGLYLKHFLAVGARLRRQLLDSIFLLMVTGLDIFAIFWSLLYLHGPFLPDAELWSKDPVQSWLDVILYAPHHMASLVCCMIAFLLAWMAAEVGRQRHMASVVVIAVALASAFGLSIFVAFGFFVLMLAWALWQFAIERKPRPALFLAAGGAGACILLLPYLWELTHTPSKMRGGSVLSFSVREMIPVGSLLESPVFQNLAAGHPLAALNLAKLALLTPSYVIEFGFSLVVFFIYLVPAWRGGTALTSAQRSLLFIAAATLPLISVVRSGVLNGDDFGMRAPFFFLFPILLLASDLITSWRFSDCKQSLPADCAALPRNTPYWLRSIGSLALIFGIIATVYQVLILRFYAPLADANMHASQDPAADNPFHNAYISSIGYGQMDRSIASNAIVQYNPTSSNLLDIDLDFLWVDHQIAISSDQQGCGSELGGDPSGCPAMAAAIDSLFKGAPAEQARNTCRQFGIQYLVARVYDPAWNDKTGWVWALPPVVPDQEFRALDCRDVSSQ